MWRFRLLLIPFAFVIEAVALAACWITALINPCRADQMVNWFTDHLPDKKWYIGE